MARNIDYLFTAMSPYAYIHEATNKSQGRKTVTTIGRPKLWGIAMLAFASGADADVRPLVIGVDYNQAAVPDIRLANTLVDAENVARAFRRIGVDTVELLVNPDEAQWRSSLERYTDSLGDDDIALVYFAGHAVQVEGENYFVAADGEGLISADEILNAVMERARGTILAIDACRNNPFRDTSTRQRVIKIRGVAGERGFTPVSLSAADATEGLSQMSSVRGMNAVVLFSTEPGNVAVDGNPGEGSPFAQAFIREISRRQSFDEAIRRITIAVSDATGGVQSPWRQGDLNFPVFLAGQPRFPPL